MARTLEAHYEEDLGKSTEILALRSRLRRVPASERRPHRRHGAPRAARLRTATGVGHAVSAAVMGTRQLEAWESAPLLTLGLALLALTAVGLWRPRVLAVPMAVVAVWIGLSFVAQALGLVPPEAAAMNDRAVVAAITRVIDGAASTDQDLVAAEAPLEILLAHPPDPDRPRRASITQSLGLVMRTPGDDADLVMGLLVGEAIVTTRADIVDLAFEAGDRARARTTTIAQPARARVTLAPSIDLTSLAQHARARPHERVRPVRTTGAAGDSARPARGARPTPRRSTPRSIGAIPAQLRRGQAVFAETGGLHAAAFCDLAGRALARSARMSAGTTRSTRSSAPRSRRRGCRPPTRCWRSADGWPTRSSRRPARPAWSASWPSVRRRAWPSTPRAPPG